MTKTLMMVNPHAGGGQARLVWQRLQPLLVELLGELHVAITERIEEVSEVLHHHAADGALSRVLAIGGDGTNNTLVNALLKLRSQRPDLPGVAYGMLPVGTGRDWARSIGAPLDTTQVSRWLARAQPRPTDIGLLTYEAPDAVSTQRYFLNIASAGLSGQVDQRVNAAPQRRPWTFLAATVVSLLRYRAEPVRVVIDSQTWFAGEALLVVVANGSTFGHGMKIAPDAQPDDGVFDVIVVENAPKLDVLLTLRRVYSGTHLSHPAVHHCRAPQVQVAGGILDLDLDGEHLAGGTLDFRVCPGMLSVLRA